jgi:HEAT repeat protein
MTITRGSPYVYALVALLAGIPAAGQPKLAKESIPPDLPPKIRLLVEQCFAPAPSARGDAAEKLGRLGAEAAPAIPFLVSMLGDDETYSGSSTVGSGGFSMGLSGTFNVGRVAAVALSKIGRPAVKPLLDVLQDQQALARERAAVALGLAGDPTAVEPLIGALGDNDPRVRREAAKALGFLKDLRAVVPLINSLADADEAASHEAQRALEELTAQTFGKDQARWREWWQATRR